MRVRQFREGDDESISAIYNKAFQNKINSLPRIYQYRFVIPEDVIHWQLDVKNALWIVELDNQPVGYAQVRLEVERGLKEIPVLQFMPAKKWDLNESNIAVLPEYQGHGVGSYLVNEIIKRYASKATIVTAYTFSDNVAGETLFSSIGFTMHDMFYYPPFSNKKPLANSSIYESFELKHLHEPSFKRPIVRFRRAEAKDAPIIRELHQHNVFWCEKCLTLEWNKEFIEGKYGHTVYVAEYEGKVIGEINYLKDGRIGITGILPEYRGKGFGSTMFYEVLREMKKADFVSAFVDSGLTQTDAIKMYEKFGFVIQRRQNCWVKVLK